MNYVPKDFQKSKPFPWLRVAGAGVVSIFLSWGW